MTVNEITWPGSAMLAFGVMLCAFATAGADHAISANPTGSAVRRTKMKRPRVRCFNLKPPEAASWTNRVVVRRTSACSNDSPSFPLKVLAMSARLLAICVVTSMFVSPASARGDVTATAATLANCLTVIVAPVHAAPVATVGVLYKAGSRDETPWTTGVAHQVEHMMFKGTTDLLKPGDIDW